MHMRTTFIVLPALMSSALTAYKRSYQKKGLKDIHEQIFGSLSEIVGDVTRVLYPGCHRHITASLVFPSVDYVDCDKKVANVYQDQKVKNWILSETKHSAPRWSFTCAFYDSMKMKSKFKDESYDLMVSLSAGIVSEPCARYIQPGGYFLVNDSHADASAAFVAQGKSGGGSRLFSLVAVWEDGKWETNNLEEYFKTTKGDYISKEQAREAAEIGSKSKRSFLLMKDTPFYLFRKQQLENESATTTEPMQRPRRKRRRLN